MLANRLEALIFPYPVKTFHITLHHYALKIDLARAELHSQKSAATQAATLENIAPPWGAHPRSEPMHTLAAADFGLPGSFHHRNSLLTK